MRILEPEVELALEIRMGAMTGIIRHYLLYMDEREVPEGSRQPRDAGCSGASYSCGLGVEGERNLK